MSNSHESVHGKHSAEVVELLEEQVGEYIEVLRQEQKLPPLPDDEIKQIAKIMLREAERNNQPYTVQEVMRMNQKGPLEENKRLIRALTGAYQKREQFRAGVVDSSIRVVDREGLVVGEAKTRKQAGNIARGDLESRA